MAPTPNLRRPPPGPTWLTEGSAEFVGYQVQVAAGLLSADAAEQWHIDAVRHGPPLPSLQSLESQATWMVQTSPYELGYLAVEFLAKRDGGVVSICRFYRGLKQSSDWPSVF